MDSSEIKETAIWALYDQCVSYCRMMGMYTDTDLNNRMYNGDQWHGLKVEGVEKVQYNIIKPIIRYKTGVVMSNLFAINFSSENFENRAFRKNAAKICELLNKKAARIWEKDFMDDKLRLAVKDAAINDEGIIYVRVDDKTGLPINERINKNDIYYGNENDSDLQSQPYILIKQRKPVSEVQRIAKESGVSADKIQNIVGDMDNIEEAGGTAKYEKDNMCTIVTKLYKDNGKVYFSQATRSVDIKADKDSGLTYYPVAHVLWEEKVGSARGEGECRYLIPNQLEINKTAMRRIVAVKNTAFPHRVANMDKIINPSELDTCGSTIKIKGGVTVDDVAKVFTYVHPAQMSSDVEKLQAELISSTRELAGAGDIATGAVNPEDASGRAILAVQQAAQQPLTEPLQYTKRFIEDLARIWLDVIIAYNDAIQLEDEVTDPNTKEKVAVLVEVQKESLKELQASVKVDITPKSAYDKFAREKSLENMYIAGMFSSQRMPETKLYLKALPDDSVMPKDYLEKVVEEWDEEQRKIAEIQNKGRMMEQRYNQFIMGDIDEQASMIAAARQQIQAEEKAPEEEPIEGEKEVAEAEEELPEPEMDEE